ncbi:MAG: AAA family ATPase [Saprospiraceae bacterium]|nr:AAA family ATPase [Candidatus Vicinibacter proximus]
MLFSDIKKAYFDGNEKRQDIKKNTNLSGLAHHHASYYIRVLDLFKTFLKDKNLVYSETQSQNEELKSFVLIIDEINRANLPAVLGELIYALEHRGATVDSLYATDEDGNIIVIPPNLYIIGTMNTSDRSVGHIDYAIRRRFAFIDVLPKVLEGETFELELFKQVSTLFIQNLDEYVQDNTVELKLSEHLSEEFRPEDVWLGHSYFIKGEGAFSLRKKYEIVPILKEYVKDGILKQSAEPIINAL